ncbi:MAG: divergent polysaccharide deacetylase family protein [Zetaproteobacteria bacterium]|nr:divergent polysaccharide deacetylase family protein [Zetaproteobacteria bacterium]
MRIQKKWLFYLMVGLLLVLLVLVGALVWKIVSSDSQMPKLPQVSPNTEVSKVLPLQVKPLKILGEQGAMLTRNAPDQPAEVGLVADKPLHHVLPLPYAMKASGLALIVDDMGYDVLALKRLLALSIPLTISILPNAPFAVSVANMTHQAGQVVMLHLPMEPMGEHYKNRMDASFLKVGMDEVAVRDMMMHDLTAVPYVEGINNHMGSRLTSMIEPMTWVMQVCREKSLFFVDSKTSSKSLAATVARQYGLVWGSRAIFLDDSVEPSAMQKAWHRMQLCVQRQQRCIVIAHPHRQTLEFLEHKLSVLQHWPVHPLRALLHRPSSMNMRGVR